jgi:predicted HicB family RNase H-like nuclease
VNKLLQHRDYFGSIEANIEDDCLFGKVQFIRALVSYEAATVSALASEFAAAVDDYIDTCEKLGVPPEVSCKGSFNVRVGHDLHLAASVTANRQDITLNDLTRRALADYLALHG